MTARRLTFAMAVAVAGASVATSLLLVSRPPDGDVPSTLPPAASRKPAPARLEPVVDGPAVDPVEWRNVRWQELATRGLDLVPGMHLDGVVPVRGGLMAFGQGPLGVVDPSALTTTLTVWLSADGSAWDPVPIRAGVAAGDVSLGAALAVGTEGAVLVGGVCCREEAPATWRSRDGRVWERTPFPQAKESYLLDVAAGDAGYAAVGSVGGRGVIWTSRDGSAWSAVPPAMIGAERTEFGSVAATASGFAVAGTVDRAGADSNAATWTSDGLGTWSRVGADDPALSGPDEAALAQLTPFAGGWFATGGTGTRAERLRCEGFLQGGVQTASIELANNCGWLREMTWRSNDLRRWERIDPWGVDGAYPPEPVAPGGQAPVTHWPLVAAGPGLVGVLTELQNGEPGEQQDLLGVYGSRDGRSWHRVADGPPLAGETVNALASRDRQLFAVTELGSVWVGTVLP